MGAGTGGGRLLHFWSGGPIPGWGQHLPSVRPCRLVVAVARCLPSLTPTQAPDSLLLSPLRLLSALLRGWLDCAASDALLEPLQNIYAYMHSCVLVGAALSVPVQSSQPKGEDEGIKNWARPP